MWIIWTILGVAALILIGVHLSARSSHKAFFKVIFAEPDFACARYYITNDGARGIALDAKRRQLCLFRQDTPTVFSYRQVDSTEIIVRGSPRSGGSGKAKVLAGHAVGTALGGTVGGVVGGMLASGKKPGDRRIHKIDLKVKCVTASDESEHTIPFLSSPAEYEDKSYETSKERIKEWHTLLSLIIEQNKHSLPAASSVPSTPAAMIRFQCDRCSKRFKVSESFAGKHGKCPQCGNKIEIPRGQGLNLSAQSKGPGICSYCHNPLEKEGRASRGSSLCSVCDTLDVLEGEGQAYRQFKGEAGRGMLLIGLPVILTIGLISYGIAASVSRTDREPSEYSGPQPRRARLTRPYADSQYGYFKCEYPSSWQVRELDDAQNRRVQFISNEGGVEIRVRIPHATATKPVDDDSIMQMLAEQGKGLMQADRSEWIGDQQLSVAGLSAYEMEYRQRQPAARCRAVFLLSGQRIHVLALAAREDDNYTHYSRMFNQFLYSYDPAR